MIDGWHTLPLSKAVGPKGRVIGGPFGSNLTQADYVDSGIPVIRVSNQVGKTIAGDFVFVSNEKAKLLRSNIAHPGDVIIVQRGSTYGKVSRVPTDGVYSEYVICQSQMAATIDNEFSDPEYIFQFLQSPFFEKYVNSSVIQTGQPHINLEILREATVKLPPLPHQRKIAEILQTWDAAIQQLDRLRAAKMKHQSALYQTLLSSSGNFPSHWQRRALSEISSRVQRQNGGGDHPVMTISAKSGFLMQSDKFSRDMAGQSIERYIVLHEGEFAYNKGNSLTAPYGCVFPLDRPTALVPFVYYCFKLSPDMDSHFYAHLFAAGALNHQLSRLINSGVRNDGLLNLNVDDFFSCKVPVPPVDEQKRISRVLTATKDELALLDSEIAALTRQKRGLMQKLLTGEWQVQTASYAPNVLGAAHA